MSQYDSIIADAIILNEYVDTLIKVETAKVFDLGGERIVELQQLMTEIFDQYFERELKAWLDHIDTIQELQDYIIVEGGEAQVYEIKKSFLDDFMTAVFDYLKIAFSIGATNVSEELKPDIGIQLGINNDYVMQYAENRSAELITKIDEVTRNEMKQYIKKAIKEGWGVRELANTIKDNYSFSRYRSTLIASQEIGQAYEKGRYQQAKDSFEFMGVKGWKLVQVHPDDRLCEICRPAGADGRIPFDQPYSNGLMGTLFHIGCRCSQSYRGGIDGKKPPLPGTI